MNCARKKKGLQKVKLQVYNCAAALELVVSELAVNARATSPKPIDGCCAQEGKVQASLAALAKNITNLTTNSILQWAFSFAAALPALSVGTSQPPERTDERKHLSAGVGRSVVCQDTQDARVDGVICVATVSRRMAVADADSSDLAKKSNVGTGQTESVCWYGITPNPR